MLFPEGHLLSTRKANPILQSVGILGDTPECAVFDLGDSEVYGFATIGGGVMNDNPNDTAWEEIVRHLTR